MQKTTENCIKANELKRLKRAFKKTLFSFKKYVDILNKNELEKKNQYLLQMYQSILNAAKTQNLSVLNDLNNQLNKMYNKVLKSEEYQIKTVFRHEKN